MVIEAFLQSFPAFGFKSVLVAVLIIFCQKVQMRLIIKRKGKRYRVISHSYAAKMVLDFFVGFFFS